MLANSARRASQSLGVLVGKLETGAAADVIVTNYFPATPLTADNLLGHLLFSLSARHVRHVIVGAQWALRDGRVVLLDEQAVRAESSQIATALWRRMEMLN